MAGEDVFASIAARCWSSPEEPKKLVELRPTESDVVGEIVELVMAQEGTSAERVQLLMVVYRRMPSYALIAQFDTYHWRELPPDGRAIFWQEVRDLLAAGNARLAAPIRYALWCDFFEGEDVEEAWKALTSPEVEDRVLECALLESAAVPFALKCEVYDRLLPLGRRWHPFVYQSVLRSEFAVMGKITKAEVHATLARLMVRHDEADHLEELEERVGSLDVFRRRLLS